MKLSHALVICSLMLITACGGSSSKVHQKEKQVARFNIHGEPPTLDPRRAYDSVSVSVTNLCFEGLMRHGKNGETEFGLAKEFTLSEDGKTYTFTLREAKWSDGEPISAWDFEESWKTILNPSFPSEMGYDLYIIKNAKAVREGTLPLEQLGIKALDAQTLRVELEYPHPHFLMMISSHLFPVVPRHIQSTYPNWPESAAHYVSSGPFRMVNWKHYNQIILEKNPEYWDADTVRLQNVELYIIEDENTELAMFENKDLDWAGFPVSQLPLDALPTLLKEGKVNLYDISGVYYYVFNTKEFPFNNANLRKAFALAINRQAIIDNVTQGKQKPALGLIPPSMWPDKVDYFKDADLQEAKRLFTKALQEMKITKQELPQLTLSYNTNAGHHKIAQAVQQQWNEAFGIQIHLENKEWKVFLDELSHHQFQIARLGGIANFNDAADFLQDYRYASSNRNYSQWFDPRFGKLMSQAEKTKEAEARKALLKEAEKILIEEMPIAPIYFYTGTFLKNPHLKDVYVSELNELNLKYAYIETER